VDLHRVPVLRLGPRRGAPVRFGYAFSVCQVEYSRNLLFRIGARMQQLFDRVVDRTAPDWTCPGAHHLRHPTGQPPRRSKP
jgi:hypothetical protein